MLKSRTTVESRLALAGNRPSGFDYLRIVLAILVVVYHTVSTSYGEAAAFSLAQTPLRTFISCLLPMFFALSGFLVAGSLERSKTVGSFLGLRALRIVPALGVETLLSALILGPIITSYKLSEYLSDPLFARYFLNILGEVHFYLPGVFTGQPTEKVNGQLWTVPWELMCYAVLAALAVAGLTRRRYFVLVTILAVLSLELFERFQSDTPSQFSEIGIFPGSLLVVSFLCGVAIYLYRKEIPMDKTLGISGVILTVALLGFGSGDIFATIPISYITIWIGLSNFPKTPLIRHADYSYGVFLYGHVIQQTYSYFFPDYRIWWMNALVCVPVAMMFAALSWGCVEKPALILRKYVYRMEASYLRWRARSDRLRAVHQVLNEDAQ